MTTTTTQPADLKNSIDYDLVELTLSSSSIGKLDLKPLMVELNYFEDIYGDSITGKIVISDAIGVLSSGIVSGTEFITINLKKSGNLSTGVKGTFRVFSVSNKTIPQSVNYEYYTLEFCSEELLLSEQYRISKAYKNSSVQSIIKDILGNILKVSKSVNIDPTSGVYDFILPNKKISRTRPFKPLNLN